MEKAILRSDIGATSAYKGYRVQTLYIVNKILELNRGFTFRPEGEEDLAIYKNEKLIQVIQVKNLTSPLRLSHLSPQKEDSFFKRSLNLLNKNRNLRITIASFGEIGPELKKALESDGIDRKNVMKKLEVYGYENEDVKTIFQNIDIAELDERKIYARIKKKLNEIISLKADTEVSFDLLMYWIYQISEEKGRVNMEDLIYKINKIGLFLNERMTFHNEFGNSIKPLDYFDISDDLIEHLKEEFYVGVSTRYEHIRQGLDVYRKDKIEKVKHSFERQNVVIIHGASGQGKSTLAYRFLYDNHPGPYTYEIIGIGDKSHAQKIRNSLSGIAKSTDSQLMIYIDVEPGDMLWVDVVKAISVYPNFKILVTIREEDWKRSILTGADLTFEDIELELTELEAKEIYKQITLNKKYDHKYIDFYDAWNIFGGQGPLLEFTYMLTQGETLRERLRRQIERIREEVREGKEINQLDILRVISLAGFYGSKVNIKKLFKYIQVNDPQGLIRLYEKEYLIRRTVDNKYIETLHSIRAQIIIEILCDTVIHPVFTIAKQCINIIDEKDIEVFLMNFFSKNDEYNEMLIFLENCEFETWIGYTGVLKSVLWLGIKEYIEKNMDIIDDAYQKYGKGWNFVIDYDIADASTKENKIIFNDLDFIDEQVKEDNQRYNSFIADKSDIYKFSNKWLSNSKEPKREPITDEDWSSCGQVLFWIGKLGINKEIQVEELNLPENIDIVSIDSLADFMLGSYYYGGKGKYLVYDNRLKLVDRFKQDNNIPIVIEDGDKISIHCIIDINDDEINESEYGKNMIHEITLNNINIMRKIYPDKKLFIHQGYGHEIGFLPLNYDYTYKNIKIEDLPINWLTEINSTFMNLGSWRYRPETWEQYVKNILEIRKIATLVIEQISNGIKANQKTLGYINIFNTHIDAGLYDKLRAALQRGNTLPKIIVDEWGITSEWLNISNNKLALMLPKNVLNIKRYKKFLKYFNEYSRTLQNFLMQAVNIMPVKLACKSKSRVKIKQIEENAIAQGIRLDYDRVSIVNLYEFTKNLPKFQREFRKLFYMFMLDEDLYQLEQREKESSLLLAGMWKRFALDEFRMTRNIKDNVNLEIEAIKLDTKNKIIEKLDILKNEDIKVGLVTKFYNNEYMNFVICNIENPLMIDYGLEKVFININKSLPLVEYIDFKHLLLELYFSSFTVIPIVRGKALNVLTYNLRLSSLLNKDIEDITILDFYQEPIDRSLLNELDIELWEGLIDKLKDGEGFVENISKIYQWAFHLSQLNEIEELDKCDETCLNILQNHVNKVVAAINKNLQDVLNFLTIEIKEFNKYLNGSLLEKSDIIEIGNLFIELNDNLLLGNSNNGKQHKEFKLSLEDIEEGWVNKLEQAIFLANDLYYRRANILIDNYLEHAKG